MSRRPFSSSSLPDREALASWLVEQAAGRLRLPAARIDPRQPLASLGLDSLSAIELAHGLEEELGVSVSLSGLLAGWSVEDLSGEILAQLAGREDGESRPLLNIAEEKGSDLPLSAGQRALWFLSRLAPESAAYHIVAAALVHGALDPEALQRALEALVARHGALRTTFPVDPQGEPRRRVTAEGVPDFAFVDAAGWSAERVESYCAAEGYRPFDLEAGPLLRVRLLQRPVGEHAVLLAVHHLVSDFGSLGVMARELSALYAEAQGGPPAALPALATTYGDFVRRQEDLLAGPEGERQWRYWRERLAGDLPALDLPADRLRPPVQTDRGGAVSLRLAGEPLSHLRQLVRRHGATLYMTLLAAFQTLLHRHTGEEDVLIGSPTAGRGAAAFAGVVGYFVNPLVLRSDLAGNPPFETFLGAVRRTALDAFAHADLPFGLLAERLQPERDPSRSPIFQSLFVLHGGSEPLAGFALQERGARLPLADLVLVPLHLRERRAQFDLTLLAAELEGGLAASLEYNADLFDRSTALRLAGHFHALLAGIAERPEETLGALPLLSAPEQAQLLVEWSGGGEAFPRGVCLHELVAAQAARTPGAEALVWREERLTYADLVAQAGRLARRLRRLEVGPEVRVAICARRSPALVAGLLGILGAGGAYVPLEPALPDERLAFLLRSSGARLLLTDEDLMERLSALPLEVPVLRLGEPDEIVAEESAADSPGVLPGNLAYVIYTSGSTGEPKGVAISHASAVALVRWAREVFPAGDLAGVLAATSIGFDLSVFELFVPLAWGGRVILAADALELPRLPAREEITLLNTVPSVLAELLRIAPLPSAVRTVNLAGEALPAALVRHIQAERVLNLYGPTEDTTYSTFAVVSESAGGSPPIGRPLPGTRVFVLDRRLRAVPAGVPGELFLGGAGLARGYLGRPDLTAERFLPAPYGPAGERLYRTGDLVRFQPDGQLEYLGRLDHQVKVRGFRIELGEIEAVLEIHPAVAGAAVLVQGEGADRRLVAAVATSATARISAAELRSFLRAWLPEPMVPAAFVLLESLPLTPNGKVDRRALARVAPAAGAAIVGRDPRGAVEEGLAAIWGEILGVEQVGAEDDFFDLGGHSLLATRLLARVRRVFGVDLPLSSLFAAPTLAGLAERIAAGLAAGSAPAPPIEPAGRPAPLSLAQRRLWFLHRLEPESPAYNMPAAVRLRGPLVPAALAGSLGKIVKRHEVLRTRFVLEGEEPLQAPAAPGPFFLPGVDLSTLPAFMAETTALRLATEEARRPFSDLAGAAPCRFRLLRLGSGEHLLLATFHHLVADGGSLEVFGRELSSLYSSFLSGRASPLPPLPIQYLDWAVWQRHWATGEEHLAWWKERLAGASTELPLPADRPRSVPPSGRGAVRSLDLPLHLESVLATLAREERTTCFVALAAGFAALLSRVTGTDDLLLGTPVAHRTTPEVEELIGLFVNTVVLRSDLSGRPSFRGLLGRMREVVLGAQVHQDLPFERLVEALEPERPAGSTALLQAVFTLAEPPLASLRLPGLSLEWVEGTSGTAKFDLTLTVTRSPAAPRATLEHADRFDATTAERLLAAFSTLLTAAVAEPGRPLAEVGLLSAAERHQVGIEWNDTAVDLAERSLGAAFWRQADIRPEAVAVSAGAEQLSYGELARRSVSLARSLAAQGVGPEVAAGLAMEHSIELIVAMLAVVQAGGIYVPLDPRYPPERLELLIRDSGARVVLKAADVSGAAPPGDESPGYGMRRMNPAWPGRQSEPGPDPLACLIYTSGSTGVPKGVAVPQRAIRRLIEGASYVRLTAEDRIAQASTPVFDAATFEIWGALLTGARLVVLPPGAPSLAELGREVRRLGVTVLWLTAGLFQQMIESQAEDLAGVGQLLAGGDVLSPPHVAMARRLLPGCRLINGYGPTEGTTFTCCEVIEDIAPNAPGIPIPIGRPISNTTAVLLDRDLQPVPIGVAGELCAGGLGLARGYWGDPARTAERFVPDPVGAVAGARLYRTGDRARLLADGRMEFLGRLDRQVKVRGFRVEPGEVEAALASHPAVRQAAVDARPEPAAAGGGHRLVAWVVGEVTAAELRRHLLTKLPEPAVPAAFFALPALPLTAQGKVDRRALAETREGREPIGPDVPRTPFEEVVAAIWAEVLGRERVGTGEDFFALGGHSLLATRVASRVRSALGVEIPLSLLFEAPTVTELAARIEAALRLEEPGGAPPLAPLPRGGDFPLSFAQERLWFLDQLEPESPFYNIAGAVRLTGTLTVPALEGSLAEVVARHEALRTTFGVEAGEPVQRIAPPGPLLLPEVDLGSLPEAAREGEAQRLAAALAAWPFDLARGPLLRLALLRLGPDRHLLGLVLHHIVADGWSIEVLRREMGALYGAFSRGLPSPLPPLPVQYADYAVWQRRRLSGVLLSRQLAHWRAALPLAASVLALPADRPRPARQSFAGGEVRSLLAPAVREALAALARREGASLFMALLAAFAALLSRHSGQEELTVGTPVANRGHREIEGLIGLFTNTLVLGADLRGDPAFAALLAQVRRTALAAYAHEDLPFERLVAELAPRRDAAHHPLFQAFLSLEDLASTPAEPVDLPGLSLSAVALPETIAKFDLSLVAKTVDGALHLTWSYARALFDRTTIARLAGHFEVLLAGLLSDPGRPLSALPLATAAELQQVGGEWNDTARDFVFDGCLHQLFASQAERTPDAVALEMEGDLLTYGELESRSNRLARHLASRLAGHGGRPEARVALFLPRSPEAVIALLALWKAGGVYLPLPVAYPRERLATLLADAEPRLLLTRRDLLGRLPEHAAEVVLLDARGRELERESTGADDPPFASAVQPSHLAYLFYTSGSTGRPKGVMIEHRNLVDFLLSYGTDVRLHAGDVMPSWTLATFDPALLEWFTPFLAGARVLLIPEERVLDLPYLTAALRGATALDGIPSLFRQIVLHLEESGQTAGWERIRSITVGGESVPTDLLVALHRLFPRAALRNTYGPTEATILCTSYPAHSAGLAGDVLGRPLANRALRLLDRAGQPVPIGVPGEIWIGGRGVGRGYFRRPDLTAERFWADDDGGRQFRTGDLARLRPDGQIEFLGRIDHQVKIRGVRIELGEIEATLALHPEVAEVAVVAVAAGSEGRGDKRLVAYVAPRTGARLGTAELRALAAERLPGAMVPATFVLLDRLPRSPHGKLDRAALPAPERPRPGSAHAAPRTAVERSLAAVWRELLGREGAPEPPEPPEVGIDDNFFELGGDSLLLIRLRSRITALLGREIPVVALFQHPTIRSLAESLEEAEQAVAASHVTEDAKAHSQARRDSLARLHERRGRRPPPRR